ncbi:hypothetical protein YC2023_104918 [Brassica napus]
MEFEGGVLLPLFHEHPMMPWNDDHMRKGDCCDCFEPQSDGYYCKLCDFFVHKKCGDELSEFISDHPSHPDHTLRLQEKREGHVCDLCGSQIQNLSYYCDVCQFDVDLHCVKYPPPDVIDNFEMHPHKLTLVKKREFFHCSAKCGKTSGHISRFTMFTVGYTKLDVLCGSISEPFVHPSHPHHPLYYIPTEEVEICNGCNIYNLHVLRCIEGDCRFKMCFKCATQPKVVKHRVDDHPLSLCYGEEEEASGKYWCDICEKETDSKEWFYTCKDQRASLHRKCVLGDSTGLMPRTVAEFEGIPHEVVLNKSVTRPFCIRCKSRCMYPITLKLLGAPEICFCSVNRLPEVKWAETTDKIFLTVVLADSKETKVNLDPEGVFDFSAKAGHENHVYELKLELHDKVNVEKHLQPERWNKLVRGGKAPHYVKVDWDKWVDEDDEGSAGAGDMDMGGMVGMDFSVCFQLVNLNFGGMGGMGGLGGMGGMGGMEEFEDSDDEEFAKPGDKKDEAVKEEVKPVDVVKEDKQRRIHGSGIMYEEKKRCSACAHPIGIQSFYASMDCDFSLHQKCAECPKRKRHVLHNDRLTLVSNKELEVFYCDACERVSNGFMYKNGRVNLDVLCGSISEPFVHQSHPHHPLY